MLEMSNIVHTTDNPVVSHRRVPLSPSGIGNHCHVVHTGLTEGWSLPRGEECRHTARGHRLYAG